MKFDLPFSKVILKDKKYNEDSFAEIIVVFYLRMRSMIFRSLSKKQEQIKINLSTAILALTFLSACGSAPQTYQNNQNRKSFQKHPLIRGVQQGSKRVEGVILRDYYDLNYFTGRGPWSDHAPIRYDNVVVWNIAQKGQEPTDAERSEGRVPNHKFLELNRSETDREYQTRLSRVADAIHEIMSSDSTLDLFLLQELPFGARYRDFAQHLQEVLQRHSLALVTSGQPGSQGIVTRRGQSVRYERIASRVLRQLGWNEQNSGRRITAFRLSPFCIDDLQVCYVSTHAVFGGAHLTADTCRIMGEMSRQLMNIYLGFTVYFGGDFNRSLSTLMQQQACRDLQFQGYTTSQEQRASGSSGDDPDVERNVDLWVQMSH